MLKKKERLTRAEFDRFFSIGKRYHSPSLQLIHTHTNDLHASVVVPKKVVRSAVKRNKVRRQIYDIIRNHKQTNRLTGVFIVILKPSATPRTYEILKGEVQTLITQVQKVR